MIYEKWGNIKFKYRDREFWCRGYYVDAEGENTKKIKEYSKSIEGRSVRRAINAQRF